MKVFLKFASFCAALVAVVALIILLATDALVGNNLGTVIHSNAVIFGQKSLLGSQVAWTGLLAFIFIVSAILILLVAGAGEVAKIKAVQKVSSLCLFVAAALLIAAGIFVFLTKDVYCGDLKDLYTTTGGWITAGIISMVSGVVALCPAVFKLLK